jgi:hypothetical protein
VQLDAFELLALLGGEDARDLRVGLFELGVDARVQPLPHGRDRAVMAADDLLDLRALLIGEVQAAIERHARFLLPC